jgi:hypothetical protein
MAKKVAAEQPSLFGMMPLGIPSLPPVAATPGGNAKEEVYAQLTCECGVKSPTMYVPDVGVGEAAIKRAIEAYVNWGEKCPRCEGRFDLDPSRPPYQSPFART